MLSHVLATSPDDLPTAAERRRPHGIELQQLVTGVAPPEYRRPRGDTRKSGARAQWSDCLFDKDPAKVGLVNEFIQLEQLS